MIRSDRTYSPNLPMSTALTVSFAVVDSVTSDGLRIVVRDLTRHRGVLGPPIGEPASLQRVADVHRW